MHGKLAISLSFCATLVVISCGKTALGEESDFRRPVISYAVVDPFSDQPILPATLLDTVRQGDVVKLVVAKGEYESASLVLAVGQTDNEEYQIDVIGFSDDELGVHSGDIDIRYVLPWYQAAGAWISHRVGEDPHPKLVPELLVKDPYFVKNDLVEKRSFLKTYKNGLVDYVELNGALQKKSGHWTDVIIEDARELQPIRLRKNYNQQIWLTVHIPENYKEGKYSGRVRIKSKRHMLEVPIEITVLPFVLEAPKIVYSMYYRGRLDPENKEVFSEYKNVEQLNNELSNIVQHGICCPTLYQRILAKYPRDKKHGPTKLINEHMAIRQKHGVDNSNLYYLGILTTDSKNEKILSQVSDAITLFQKSVEKFDIQNTYIYGVEEVRGGELAGQNKAWDSAKKNGVKIFTAGNTGHVQTMQGETDLLIYYGAPDRVLATKVHSYGNKIFSYANPQSGPENPSGFRKNYGYLLLANDFDGAMIYAYQHAFGNIWNDFDHDTYRDHVLAYPTTTSVIDTIAWEGLREAVDDVRYFSTYENESIEKGRLSDSEIFKAKIKATFEKSGSLSPDIIRRQLIQELLLLNEPS